MIEAEPTLELSLHARGIQMGSSVNPEDVDSQIRATEASDRSYRVRTIINEWSIQQREDRALRRRYANWVLGFLGFELLFISVAFLLIGSGAIVVMESVSQVFIGSVFAQVIAVSAVVMKYLFPDSSVRFLELLEKLDTPGGREK